MNPVLCLPLLAVLLQPALYQLSYFRAFFPDSSDLTVECGTTMITVEVNLCSAQWAGFNASMLALNGNHDNIACLGTIDESRDPPIVRYHLPVNSSGDNSCRQSLQVRTFLLDHVGSSFSNIQSVIITSYIDTPKSDAGIISYSTDLYYYFSCRYPLEYLINNTKIVASSVSVATTSNNGSFIDMLKMSVFNDTDYRHPLVVPPTGLELRTKVYVEVKAVNLTGNFNVMLDHCFATPSPYNMTQPPKTKRYYNGVSDVARFNFEAFRFVQHRDQEKSSIYLHCIMSLCEPSKCQELLSLSKEILCNSDKTCSIAALPLVSSAEAAMFFRLNCRSSLRHTSTRLKANADWTFVW
uniref:Si:dkey-103g5.3 n=1 Tax=Fundulus heteroclitus TaxID=8078 RepID=A0A3Q2QCM1_FUNHE